MSEKRILIVDDEVDILNLVQFNLNNEGYFTETAETGEEALKIARTTAPHLIVLDLMLPGIDGLDVCRLLKNDKRTEDIPIIMLSAKGSEKDVIEGLEIGANDYVTKPFSPKMLMARIKAVLRGNKANASETENEIVVENMIINTDRRRVKVDNKRIDLTTTEFDILFFLIKHPGWVFTRSQIINSVKGTDYAVTDRSVDVQILNLRRKLGDIGEYVETGRGVGYRFKEL